MANFRTTNKKQLAARVLCGLLLSTYLTGAYSMPVAWGGGNPATHIYEDDGGIASVNADGTVVASAWGTGTTALGKESTAFGIYSTANGNYSTAFGSNTEANGNNTTAFGNESKAIGPGATAWGGYFNSIKDNAIGGTANGAASTAFGIHTTAEGEASTAFGGNTEATKDFSTAFGLGSKAHGIGATAFGLATTASTYYATAWGGASVASGEGATAWGGIPGDHYDMLKGGIASGNASTAFGIETEASGVAATAWGKYSVAGGNYSTAFGDSSQALAENSLAALGGIVEKDATNGIAIGKGSTVSTPNGIAIGTGLKVSGKNSGAFGDPGEVSGSNSYAFGNNNSVSGDNTFVFGNNVKTGAKNAVVLGDGSEGVDNAVSVGAKGKERQIKNVAPGTDDTDATTVKQVKEMIEAGGGGADLTQVNHRISNLDSKINKVGAGAAALAALHPLDTDNKFTMAAGFGNYRNANAMALGMFYRPTDKVMFSVGGAMGNGENMINAGVSFALDKGVGTSKAAMARTIKAQGDRIAEQDAKIQSLEAYNAKLEERLATLEAKIGK